MERHRGGCKVACKGQLDFKPKQEGIWMYQESNRKTMTDVGDILHYDVSGISILT